MYFCVGFIYFYFVLLQFFIFYVFVGGLREGNECCNAYLVNIWKIFI